MTVSAQTRFSRSEYSSANKLILGAACTALALLVLLLPSYPEGHASQFLGWLHRNSLRIADVRAMASASEQPLVLSTTYAMALLFGPLLALVATILTVDRQPFKKLALRLTKTRRVLMLTIFPLLILAPFFFDLTIPTSQVSYPFFSAVRTNRVALLIWTEGVLLASYFLFLWCLFELSNLWKKEKNER